VRLPVALAYALGIAGLDQLTKSMISARIALGEVVPVIPGFFSLTHSRNRGAAFGIFSDLPDPWRGLLLVSLPIFAVVAFTWMLASVPRRDVLQRVALASVIGGALGNLCDRVVYGEVVDFIDFYAGSFHWATFNVADSFLTIGVTLLIFSAFFGDDEADPVEDLVKTE
jgi:signal peptidase II